MEQIAEQLFSAFSSQTYDLDRLKALIDPLTKEQLHEFYSFEIQKDGTSLFHRACAWSYIPVVEYLLKKGTDVNLKDKMNQLPLVYNAGFGRTAVVKLLLEHGANVHEKDVHDPVGIALSSAAAVGSTKTMDVLLEYGADVNAAFDSGTALHTAIYNRSFAAVKYLVARGADVNARSQNNSTPLGLCFNIDEKPLIKAAQLLLEHGATLAPYRAVGVRKPDSLRMLQPCNVQNLQLNWKIKLQECPEIPSVRAVAMDVGPSQKPAAFHRRNLDLLQQRFPNVMFVTNLVRVKKSRHREEHLVDVGHGWITSKRCPLLSDYGHALDVLCHTSLNYHPEDPGLLATAIALLQLGVNLDDVVWRILIRSVVVIHIRKGYHAYI
eukprot:TRINITY_DN4929_c0_g1_i2.p1 TRINITY_DN4929_c0_g1~~TRINITY_DN4929_c0_g1_i2.p1  ORF type:complete len:380 (+),score=79.27 TRINITY_DN4929_c0_g1_i2:103-1242(+)